MVQPVRTWTIAINQAPSVQDNQLTQFRDVAFAWKTLMVAAGWTVVRSSNGDAGAAAPGGGLVGDSDNWTAGSVLGVDDTAGGGAWIVLQAPSAFLAAGGTCFLLGFINEPDIVNPQQLQIQMSTLTYTGGTTTALPTSVGTTTTIDTINDNMLPTASGIAEPIRYATWRSTRGDVFFMVKREGVKAMEYAFIVTSNDDSNGGGQGSHRFVQLQGAGTLFNNNVSTSTRSYNAAGTAAATTLDWTNVLNGITGDSLDYLNNAITAPYHLITDLSSNLRYFGQAIDIYAAPNHGTLADSWGRLIDDETSQTQRRVCLGLAYFFAPTADLPFI